MNLKKIQELPPKTKIVIIFVIVIVLGIFLGRIWIERSIDKMKNIDTEGTREEFKIPSLKKRLEESIPKMPNVEAPDLNTLNNFLD